MGQYLQSVSKSLPSFVFRRNFNDRRLNEPPVVVAVPRRKRNGRTAEAAGRRAENSNYEKLI